MVLKSSPLPDLTSPPASTLGGNGQVLVLQATAGEAVVLPGGPWFLRADFSRQGQDLKLTGPDGQQILIREYFSLESPPDLTTADGSVRFTFNATQPALDADYPERYADKLAILVFVDVEAYGHNTVLQVVSRVEELGRRRA